MLSKIAKMFQQFLQFLRVVGKPSIIDLQKCFNNLFNLFGYSRNSRKLSRITGNFWIYNYIKWVPRRHDGKQEVSRI